MTVVDTTVLLAAMVASHPQHARARSLITDAGALTVTWGTLEETSRLARRMARAGGEDADAAARTALRGVLAISGFREAPAVPLPEVVHRHALNRRLSFVDAWNLSVAVALQEPLLTFDRDLALAHRKAR